MEFRNPVYNRHGTIDCEVNHPRLGWIAFTASPDDPEESGRDIYAAAARGNVGEYVAPEVVASVPTLISDRQFFQALASPPYEIITQQEALAAVKTGEIPGAMMAMVEALPQAAQFSATMLISGATTFYRNHSLTGTFGAAFGWTDAQIDAFFIAAAAL